MYGITLQDIKQALEVKEQAPESVLPMFSRGQVERILCNHGLTFSKQTGAINGVLVEKGTSFDECFGKRELYSRKAVRLWLGY